MLFNTRGERAQSHARPSQNHTARIYSPNDYELILDSKKRENRDQETSLQYTEGQYQTNPAQALPEKNYFSKDRIYVEDTQDYHTERRDYKSVQRKKRKKSAKRLSSKKRHESSKRRLANKRDLSLKEGKKIGYVYTGQDKENYHVISPHLKKDLESINSHGSRKREYDSNGDKIYKNR